MKNLIVAAVLAIGVSIANGQAVQSTTATPTQTTTGTKATSVKPATQTTVHPAQAATTQAKTATTPGKKDVTTAKNHKAHKKHYAAKDGVKKHKSEKSDNAAEKPKS